MHNTKKPKYYSKRAIKFSGTTSPIGSSARPSEFFFLDALNKLTSATPVTISATFLRQSALVNTVKTKGQV